MTQKEKEDTTLTVKKDTWKKLNMRKEPGDTFDDVIRKLLKEVERK